MKSTALFLTLLVAVPAMPVASATGETAILVNAQYVEPITFAAAGVVNDELYVLGGGSGIGTAPRSIYKYDAAGDSWQGPVAQLPAVYHFGAYVTVGSAIYLIGGQGNTYCGSGGNYAQATTDIVKFVPSSSAVSIAGTLPFPFMGGKAFVVDSKIYVTSGYSPCDPSYLNHKVVVIDTSNGAVHVLPQQAPCWITFTMDFPDAEYAVCHSYPQTILKFDRGLERFVDTGLVFPVERQSAGIAVAGGFAYVLGGTDGSSLMDTIYKFDPATGVVTLLSTTLPARVHGAGFATRSTGTYLVGGWTTCQSGNCGWDRTIRFTAGLAAPEPTTGPARPTGLQPGSNTPNQPEDVANPQPILSWNPSTSAVSYRVTIKATSTSPPVFDEDVGSATSWRVPVDILTAGRTYQWTVVAVGAIASSPPSLPAYIRVTDATPTPVLRLLPDLTRSVLTGATCANVARLDVDGRVSVPVQHSATQAFVRLCAADGSTVTQQGLTDTSTFVFTFNTNIDTPTVPLSLGFARYTPGLVGRATFATSAVALQCAIDANHAGHDSGCKFTSGMLAAISPPAITSFQLDFDVSQPFPRYLAPSGACGVGSSSAYQSYIGPAADRFSAPTPVVIGLLKTESSLIQYSSRDCYTLIARDGGLGASQITGVTFASLASSAALTTYLATLGEQRCSPGSWNAEMVAACLAGSAKANAVAGTYWLSVKRDLVQGPNPSYPCTHMTDAIGQNGVPVKHITANWVGPVAWYKGRAISDPEVRRAFVEAGFSNDWTKRAYVAAQSSPTWQIGATSTGDCTLSSPNLLGPL